MFFCFLSSALRRVCRALVVLDGRLGSDAYFSSPHISRAEVGCHEPTLAEKEEADGNVRPLAGGLHSPVFSMA